MARGIKGKSLREVTRNGVPSVIGGKKELSPRHKEKLLAALKARFEENMNRHEGIKWSHALAKLEANPKKLWSLNEMERTGGEPDVIEFEKKTGKYIFVDCSEESPSGRRSLSYDRDGEENARDHGFGPRGNAVDMAKAMGIAILTEKRYRELQKLGSFDRGTWSWIRTSRKRRSFGCALSGVCIKGNCEVFVAGGSEPTLGRAFRGLLKV
ncbi:DUF4256 domain-containing protein [Patescibacteria group bacterium]|nr:DUF4256 domain-containing protein [Patescibacteria group bacterium]MBU1703130.1 DUF4256 domain-containing protein [Patescibacteria group bacterium]MBU1954300.1 DUF4256 domain-containing protein [Patescibacteria group bacterium]